MGPITALSATAAVSAIAGKSWQLVNYIDELCEGIKTVDERVQKLLSGATELASALEQCWRFLSARSKAHHPQQSCCPGTKTGVQRRPSFAKCQIAARL
jgi:hypothetical protein